MKDPAEILAEARRIGLLTSDDRVSRDVPCIECEYNTRTLAFDGRCPECNTPVATTLDAHISIPHQWLERVARGVTLLMLGVALLLIFTLLILGESLGLKLHFGSASPAVLLFPGAGFSLAGLLLATVKAPPALPDRCSLSPRRGVRLMLAVACAGVVLIIPVAASGWNIGVLAELAGFAVLLALLPLFFLRHLARIAQLVGSSSRARALRVGGWVTLAMNPALIVSAAWLDRAVSHTPVASAAATAIIFAVALVAFLVPTARLLNRAAWPEASDASTDPARGNSPER